MTKRDFIRRKSRIKPTVINDQKTPWMIQTDHIIKVTTNSEIDQIKDEKKFI